MRPVIIVFAKAPRPGHVKTRLTPALTPVQAAELHSAFVHDTLANLQVFEHADIELHTDIDTDAWRNFQVPRRLQHEGDLGLKMFHALNNALTEGRPQAIVLGSDAPDLPAEHISQLLAAKVDIAIGPAVDGGYYAIAARRVHPAMFADVEWSTSRVLEQTAAACRECRLTVDLASVWSDLDTPADLARLMMGGRRAKESLKTLSGFSLTPPPPRAL